MKIVMFSDCFFPRINGVCVSVLSFAKELVKNGHQVSIVCPNYKNNKNLFNHAFEHHYIEYIDVAKGKKIEVYRMASNKIIFSDEDRLAKISQWHSLKKYLDSIGPDIIHINSEYLIGRFGSHYAGHRKIPLVYTFHTYWEDYIENYAEFAPKKVSRMFGREISMFFLKRANTIIAPTKRFSDVIESYGIKRDVQILPTGIDNSFHETSKKSSLKFFNQLHKIFPTIKKKHILLYVGRVAKEKNLPFLLDMFGEVKKQVKDTVLVIVGDGPDLPELKAKASKLSYKRDICFAGYKNQEDVAFFYKVSDVFVFPSVTETQGLVTIEAMTVGLPVVAIGEMGTADVMQGDNGGFMVKNDIKEFSDKVIQLLTNKELHESKSKEAIEWSKQWSLSVTTQKLIAIYENTLSNFKK